MNDLIKFGFFPYMGGTGLRSDNEIAQTHKDCFLLWNSHFKLNRKEYGEIGNLWAELQHKGMQFQEIKLPTGRKVLKPGVFEIDAFLKETVKIKNELHELAQIIESIEAGNVQKWEIQIKINKGKQSRQTITIGHKENLSLIIKQLKQLPKGEPMPKISKGNPGKKELKQFIQYAVRRCYEIIQPTDPELTDDDKLFFAGIVLSFAGILPPPRELNCSDEIEPHQITDLKKKLSDYLNHYKPTEK